MSLEYEKVKRQEKAQVPVSSRNVNNIPHSYPPTESQLELIVKLKTKLNDAGKDTSYLAEPDTKFIAMHVINSLIRLCKKYHL